MTDLSGQAYRAVRACLRPTNIPRPRQALVRIRFKKPIMIRAKRVRTRRSSQLMEARGRMATPPPCSRRS